MPDRNHASDADLLASCVDALAESGLLVRSALRGATGADRNDLEVRTKAGSQRYTCVARRNLRPATLGPVRAALAASASKGSRPLLCADHVSPQMAERLRAAGVEFVDTAGNAFLQGRGLQVLITGRRVPVPSERRRRVFRAAGLKVLFVLLSDSAAARWTVRQLAASAGVSVGAVDWALRDLRELGHLVATGSAERELRGRGELTTRFESGYAETLRPALHVRTCRLLDGTLDDLARRCQSQGDRSPVLVGGELAAAILTGRLRPAGATLHVYREDLPALLRRLRLVPDPAGTIALVRAFGSCNGGEPDGIAHRMLVRAELLASPDERLHQIADELFPVA